MVQSDISEIVMVFPKRIIEKKGRKKGQV